MQKICQMTEGKHPKLQITIKVKCLFTCVSIKIIKQENVKKKTSELNIPFELSESIVFEYINCPENIKVTFNLHAQHFCFRPHPDMWLIFKVNNLFSRPNP